MSATCPTCGGAAVMLLTSIACDACDRKPGYEAAVAEFQATPAPRGYTLDLSSYDEMWKAMLPASLVEDLAKWKSPWANLKRKKTLADLAKVRFDRPPPAARRVESVACQLCGNPAAVLAITGPDGVPLPITFCACVPPNNIAVITTTSGWNGVARLDDDAPETD